MNAFIQQECITLIKGDGKFIYNIFWNHR